VSGYFELVTVVEVQPSQLPESTRSVCKVTGTSSSH